MVYEYKYVWFFFFIDFSWLAKRVKWKQPNSLPAPSSSPRCTPSRHSSSRSSPPRSSYSMYSYPSLKPSTSFSCSSPCSSPYRKRPRNKTTGPTMKNRSTPTEAFDASVTQQYNVCLATEEKGQWVGCSHRGKKCDYWVHDLCTGFSFKTKKILKQVAFQCPQHNKWKKYNIISYFYFITFSNLS